MTESIPHDGRLRFSEEIPYTPEMLATVLGDDIKKLQSAIDVLKKFKLMKFESDRTIFLPEVPKMMGSETKSASRVRKHREGKALQSNNDVTKSKTKRKDKDLDLEKQQENLDDDACDKKVVLDTVDVHRLSTVFGDYSEHTKREYLKLKRKYDDDALHSAIEKTWVLGGKTIGYTRKILEEQSKSKP